MLLVRDVDIMSFDDDRPRAIATIEEELFSTENRLCSDDLLMEDKKLIRKELIRGQRFVDVNGREIVIGLTQKVQEAIGLPFMAFENMSKRNTELSKRNADLEREKNKIAMALNAMIRDYAALQKMSFWKRYCFRIVSRWTFDVERHIKFLVSNRIPENKNHAK